MKPIVGEDECPGPADEDMMQQHMSRALVAEFPMCQEEILDDDMMFGCRAAAVIGPCLRAWRRRQTVFVQKVARALKPWDAHLLKLMESEVHSDAFETRPAVMVFSTTILR